MAKKKVCTVWWCSNPADNPKYVRCTRCRLANRRHHTTYKYCGSKKSNAYRKRSQKKRQAITSRWCLENADKRQKTLTLNTDVKMGLITKPTICSDCRQSKKPIVAWEISLTGESLPNARVSVKDWCCWKCWWVRRRGVDTL